MTENEGVEDPIEENEEEISDEESEVARKKRPLLRLILAAIVLYGGYSLFDKYYVPPLNLDYERPTAGWLRYGMNDGGERYSPSNQITPANASKLEVAWIYRTGDAAENNRSQIQCNPLIIDGVLYATAGYRRAVVAILKHNTPCGVGAGATALEAYENAFATDPDSPRT